MRNRSTEMQADLYKSRISINRLNLGSNRTIKPANAESVQHNTV